MSEAGIRAPIEWTLNPDDNSWFRNHRWQTRLLVRPASGDGWEVHVSDWEGAWALPTVARASWSLDAAKLYAELYADAWIGPHDWERDLTHEYEIAFRSGGRQRWWARNRSLANGTFALHLGEADEILAFDLADIATVRRRDEQVFPDGPAK